MYGVGIQSVHLRTRRHLRCEGVCSLSPNLSLSNARPPSSGDKCFHLCWINLKNQTTQLCSTSTPSTSCWLLFFFLLFKEFQFQSINISVHTAGILCSANEIWHLNDQPFHAFKLIAYQNWRSCYVAHRPLCPWPKAFLWTNQTLFMSLCLSSIYLFLHLSLSPPPGSLTLWC